ncbi:hypothetical protein [Streptomyces sp. NPDC006638]|uniref:hypothetical protein n=1 Tax=Streptomyces sp. NPDC006638 TaxID=3157183 RepID=UPI0033B13BEE
MNVSELVHQYAEAIAYMDGPDGRYGPDEWLADEVGRGRLIATFWYRRTEPVTRAGVEIAPVVNPHAWPHGVELQWDSVTGWAYAGMVDHYGDDVDFYEPLRVDKLASPATILTQLRLLLDDHNAALPSSSERWQQPTAATLAEILCLAPSAPALVGHSNDRLKERP